MSAPHPALAALRGDVPGNAWPPLHSSRLGSLAALIRELDATQWLSPEAIAEGERRQLTLLARHYADRSPQFLARLKSAGLTADTLADNFAALPLLERRTLQADPGTLEEGALPAGHKPIQFVQTSGSTGEPVKVAKTAVTQLFWAAMTIRYHLWHERDFTGRLAAARALMPDPGPSATWGTPFTAFFDTGPALRIDNGVDIAAQAADLAAFKPDTLIVYPTNLAALLDRIEAGDLALPTLKRVRTIAETLPPEVRRRAEAALGASVRDCYSSEEAGYLAIECPEGGQYHVMAETLLIEVIDEAGRPCREGEVGRIVVTDLHNHATPIIRYAIGDHAEVGGRCRCGRGLPTLKRILGRTRNMILLPDGRSYWPLTANKRLREFAPVIQYQYIQESLDSVEARLVVERPLTAEEEDALRGVIRLYLGHDFAIRFTYFDLQIPKGRNGKFEEFKRSF